jgi:hypothetical protein
MVEECEGMGVKGEKKVEDEGGSSRMISSRSNSRRKRGRNSNRIMIGSGVSGQKNQQREQQRNKKWEKLAVVLVV